MTALPLDHLPFRTRDLSSLRRAFAALGFSVSPPGAYTSADFPEARWPCRAVFLRTGWFDLLQDEGIDPRAPSAPGACLFRTHDLDASAKAFADVRTEAPYRLERRWDSDLGLPAETFRLFSIRERIAPLGLAVIAHAWPCPDIAPAWMEHANGAVAVAGLVFGGAAPAPAAAQCGSRLDLSGFDYLDAEAFAARFGPGRRQIAVRIKVRSLSRARTALELRGTAWESRGGELSIPHQGALDCAFSFFE
jgi:hypothetical protein